MLDEVARKNKNKKFWEELIRLLSLHKTFIWSTWT
jgi:hypothetical protein